MFPTGSRKAFACAAPPKSRGVITGQPFHHQHTKPLSAANAGSGSF